MSNDGKKLILNAAGGVALLMVGWGILQLLLSLATGILQFLLSLATIIPTAITGVFFLILQIVVLLLSVIVLGALGFLIINIILNILSKFEESFTNQIASLRRLINKVTNNLASEVLAIITAFLIAVAQDHFSSNDIAKYSIGILSGVYLFFSVQLIKSENRRDRFIGIFFYIFPVLVAAAYYATDIRVVMQAFSHASVQDFVFPVAAFITLMLAFYYSFKPQDVKNDG